MKGTTFVVLFLWAGAFATTGYAEQANRRGREEQLFPAAGSEVFQPVLWQRRRGEPPPRPLPRRAAPLPPGLRERLQKMPPEERERVLENNRRFQQLPRKRQEELRERLRQLQEMSPEQRELIEQRFAIFRNLTPRQQERARQIYERRWRRLPPERRRALLEEFRDLREMSGADREQRLSSEDFQNNFNTDERELLRQLVAL